MFINSGTHERSVSKPYGNESLDYVKDANLFLGERDGIGLTSGTSRRFAMSPRLLRLTSRTVMALMVISVRCGYWFIEQPGSSKLIHNPELDYLLSLLIENRIPWEFTRLSMP